MSLTKYRQTPPPSLTSYRAFCSCIFHTVSLEQYTPKIMDAVLNETKVSPSPLLPPLTTTHDHSRSSGASTSRCAPAPSSHTTSSPSCPPSSRTARTTRPRTPPRAPRASFRSTSTTRMGPRPPTRRSTTPRGRAPRAWRRSRRARARTSRTRRCTATTRCSTRRSSASMGRTLTDCAR